MFRRLLISLTGIIIATPCFAVCPICVDITDMVCMSQKQACEANEASMRLNEEMLQQQMMQQQQDLMMQQQQDMLMQQQMMGSQF